MMKKTNTSTAAAAGRTDGELRASCDRYEDYDPRGGFNGQRTLTEIDWPEYKSAYEAGYLAALKQLKRGRFAS